MDIDQFVKVPGHTNSVPFFFLGDFRMFSKQHFIYFSLPILHTHCRITLISTFFKS